MIANYNTTKYSQAQLLTDASRNGRIPFPILHAGNFAGAFKFKPLIARESTNVSGNYVVSVARHGKGLAVV